MAAGAGLEDSELLIPMALGCFSADAYFCER